jgi:hypothetical protein
MIDQVLLSEPESRAVGRVLRYWTTRWDWECPTLFGLAEAEFRRVGNAWPTVGDLPDAGIAVVGALREFLWGASAAPRDVVLAECGLSYVEASSLLQRLVANGKQDGADRG